jgi:hypothetical protein
MAALFADIPRPLSHRDISSLLIQLEIRSHLPLENPSAFASSEEKNLQRSKSNLRLDFRSNHLTGAGVKILNSDANKSPETLWPITGMTLAYPLSYSYIRNLVVAAGFSRYLPLPSRFPWRKPSR